MISIKLLILLYLVFGAIATLLCVVFNNGNIYEVLVVIPILPYFIIIKTIEAIIRFIKRKIKKKIKKNTSSLGEKK